MILKSKLNTMTLSPLKRIKLFVLDLFFPNRCPFCYDVIAYDKYCCGKCLEKLDIIDNYCSKCGKVICECSELLYYDRCEVSCVYDSFMQKAILNLKNNYAFNLPKILCQDLADKLRNNSDISDIYCITAVPAGKAHKKKADYNQSEEIAKCLSELLDIKCDFKLLKRTNVKRPQQHTLTVAKRKKNVIGMYEFNDKYKGNIIGKRVIICDDVTTTGSTLNECAKILKKNGISQVYCAALAVTNKK